MFDTLVCQSREMMDDEHYVEHVRLLLADAEERRLNILDSDQEVPHALVDEIEALRQEVDAAGCCVVDAWVWE